MEEQIFEKLEVTLVGFLRQRLNHDELTIRVEVEEIQEEKKLYTSKDKFDHLVKQNPAIKDLRDKLGLDFDY